MALYKNDEKFLGIPYTQLSLHASTRQNATTKSTDLNVILTIFFRGRQSPQTTIEEKWPRHASQTQSHNHDVKTPDLAACRMSATAFLAR